MNDRLQRYLDGELSEQEALELFEEILERPEEFLAQRQVHHDLRVLLNSGARPEAFAAGVVTAQSRRATDDFVRAVKNRIPPKKTTFLWPWLAAAAAVALAVAGLVLLREEPRAPIVKERPKPAPKPAPLPPKLAEEVPPLPPTPPPPKEEPKPKEIVKPPPEPSKPEPEPPKPKEEAVKPPPPEEPKPEPKPEPPPPAPMPEKPKVAFAKVDRVIGKSELEGRPVEIGNELFAGQTVRVAAGRTTLLYPDSTRVKIDEASEVVFGENGKKIELKRGRLILDVARQPKGQSVTLSTPHADIEVQGTQFMLYNGGESTRIEVEEGAVKFTRKSDGRSIRVSQGNYAVAPGTPFLAKPIPAVLFQENFNAHGGEKPPPGWDAPERASFAVVESKGEKVLVPDALNRAIRIGIPWRIDRDSYAMQMRFKFGERKIQRLGIQLDNLAIEIDPDQGVARLAIHQHDKEPTVLAHKAIALKPGIWHAWRVEIRGKKIRLLLDGGEALSHETDALEDATQITLVGRAANPFECDDVQILRLGP